jgi:hypothetical protein
MLIQPIVVNVIVKSKSARMLNLNESELFLYRIIEYLLVTYYKAIWAHSKVYC